MQATGDVRHMDYQRLMTLSLESATLNGAVVSGSVADWNGLWKSFERKDLQWVQNERWDTFYGVRLTLKQGATWQVTGPSTLSSLTLESGARLVGRVEVDGRPVTPVAGETYTGRIAVVPL